MHAPAHPGEIIRKACLNPLELTVTEAADGLGVTRKAPSATAIGAFHRKWLSALKKRDGAGRKLG